MHPFKLCNSVIFEYIYSVVWPSLQSNFRTFSSTQKRNLISVSSHSSFFPCSPSPKQPLTTFCLYKLVFSGHDKCNLFWKINVILQYVAFCVWFLSLSIVFERFICVAACISNFISFYCQIIFHCLTVVWF